MMLAEAWEVLDRSYAGKLVRDYVDRFDQEAGSKLNFSLLSEREEAFEHLLEVFEQDLRLGEPVAWPVDASLLLKNVALFLLANKTGEDPLVLVNNNLALKGLVYDPEEVRLAKEWLSAT